MNLNVISPYMKVSRRFKRHVVAVVLTEASLLVVRKDINYATMLVNISSLIRLIQLRVPTINLRS
jgi:hypothetical protein